MSKNKAAILKEKMYQKLNSKDMLLKDMYKYMLELEKKRKDLLRALVLARKAYETADSKIFVAARVSCLYRKLGEPDKALQWTEPYARSTYVPLLNSRAAAFADIGEYLQAKKLAGKSLSISPGNSDAFDLLDRVHSEYPGAYYELF